MGSANKLLIICICCTGVLILLTVISVIKTVNISKTKLEQIAFDLSEALDKIKKVGKEAVDSANSAIEEHVNSKKPKE